MHNYTNAVNIEQYRVIAKANSQLIKGYDTGGNWVNFCWVCAAGLSEPLPHYSSSFCGQLYRPHLSHFLFLCIDPCFRLNKERFTFLLQCKHSGTCANRKYEKLMSFP